MMQELFSGIQNSEEPEDAFSPEQMLQDFMMSGLKSKNLFRRSRLGFPGPAHGPLFEQMLRDFPTNTLDNEDLFSPPSMSSSSFSRTHTISDEDGRVEMKQTKCEDGICITRMTSSSTPTSVNPFMKIKALQGMRPKEQAPCGGREEVVEDDMKVSKIAVKPATEVPKIFVKEEKTSAPKESKEKSLVQDLASFASALEKGIEAARAESPKGSSIPAVIAAVTDKMKEEHVMEV
jgi:hypothetical protein